MPALFIGYNKPNNLTVFNPIYTPMRSMRLTS